MVNISHVNILDYLPSQNWKRKNAHEVAGVCPKCGGDDRFIVWTNQNSFWCRQCQFKGDVITYLRECENLSFVEACERLNVSLKDNANDHKPRRTITRTTRLPVANDAPALSTDWSDYAKRYTSWAHDNLMSNNEMLDYLYNRGITKQVIKIFQLGYCPKRYRWHWGELTVNSPRGIVFTYHDKDMIPRRLNVRQMPTGKPKYLQVTGGANWLYGSWRLKPNSLVVMVESEVDALSIYSAIGFKHVVAVATGSISHCRITRWIAMLATAHTVMIAFDTDAAGNKASEYWLNTLPNAVRLRPTKHDVNDMLVNKEDITRWINSPI